MNGGKEEKGRKVRLVGRQKELELSGTEKGKGREMKGKVVVVREEKGEKNDQKGEDALGDVKKR